MWYGTKGVALMEMNCPQQITHAIRRGDNLFQLSRRYQTAVPDILALNPGVDPYNLPVGSTITICSGARRAEAPACEPDCAKKMALASQMRLAWLQHVYWTRMLIISIAERLRDQQAVTNRLLQNPGDIADIFAEFYPPETAAAIEGLLTEHLKIGGDLITALRDGNSAQAATLNRQWYRNADQMADAFSSINPYWDREALRRMLYEHLDLVKQETTVRLNQNYAQDIEVFDNAEKQALAMADMFTDGLMKQFPQRFCYRPSSAPSAATPLTTAT
jgi:hypothetical protein